MNMELEKILEEIDEEILLKKVVWNSIEKPPYNDFEQSLWIAGMRNAKEIIRKYMNDGWIPVEERLPEEHSSIFAKFKGTTKWNNAMFETCSNEVNITIEDDEGKSVTAHAHTNDGKWKCDLLRLNPQYHVTAWRPLPEPYKPERN